MPADQEQHLEDIPDLVVHLSGMYKQEMPKLRAMAMTGSPGARTVGLGSPGRGGPAEATDQNNPDRETRLSDFEELAAVARQVGLGFRV